MGTNPALSGIFSGSLPSAFQVREFSPQQTVRQPSKSVRIQKEMAVSPQALRTQSVAGQNFVDSVNPATGEVVARIPATPLSAIPAIFEAARAAQKAWAARPLSERCAMLRKLRDAIFERRDDIANIVISRNRQTPRRSHPRRSTSRARHRELPRAPGTRDGCAQNESRTTTSR